MKKEDIDKIVDVRNIVLNAYNSLDGRSSPSVSVIKQQNVAAMCESVIKKIDDILSPYVNFK